jgi:hypothetical protein
MGCDDPQWPTVLLTKEYLWDSLESSCSKSYGRTRTADLLITSATISSKRESAFLVVLLGKGGLLETLESH